ncbi:MAG: HetP family heterocyst commitment protein [Phormidesmis sp. CAN_BIN44]|nr:HetP family heterocyst commitment protein [Phormidesmis sp. CAN_BIN44]
MGFPSSYTPSSIGKSSTQTSTSKLDKVMDLEQFNQVVDAILEGKYSWACVLILRSSGYNPCHYIPRRTYSRLVKENLRELRHNRAQTNVTQATSSSQDRIPDLAYLKALSEHHAEVHGGRCALRLANNLRESGSFSSKGIYIRQPTTSESLFLLMDSNRSYAKMAPLTSSHSI